MQSPLLSIVLKRGDFVKGDTALLCFLTEEDLKNLSS